MYTYRQDSSPQLDETAALGILKHLEQQQLQALLDDDTKLQDLISDLQQVKNLEVDNETVLASNKSLADYNLSREPKLAQAKEQLAEVYTKAVEMQKDYEKNKQKMDYISAQQSLDTTLALLQTEAAKSEEESEEISDKFVEGDIEIEDFVDQYIQKRTVAHLRKVKSEKMAEILRDRQSASRGGSFHSQGGSFHNYNSAPVTNNWGPPPVAAPPPVANNWGGAPAPYPTGQFVMPDPNAYLPR